VAGSEDVGGARLRAAWMGAINLWRVARGKMDRRYADIKTR
jgi:hypothetical protein